MLTMPHSFKALQGGGGGGPGKGHEVPFQCPTCVQIDYILFRICAEKEQPFSSCLPCPIPLNLCRMVDGGGPGKGHEVPFQQNDGASMCPNSFF